MEHGGLLDRSKHGYLLSRSFAPKKKKKTAKENPGKKQRKKKKEKKAGPAEAGSKENSDSEEDDEGGGESSESGLSVSPFPPDQQDIARPDAGLDSHSSQLRPESPFALGAK